MLKLTNKVEMAWLMAEKQHVGQYYGPFTYIKHLKDCDAIYEQMVDYFFDEIQTIEYIFPKERAGLEELRCVIILHDALEDGRMSYNDIRKFFGEIVADGVFCISDDPGKNRDERKNYERIKSNTLSRIAKLIDRYANMAHSRMEGGSMFNKYKKEFLGFKNNLTVKNPHPFETYMWGKLNELIKL